MEVLQGMGGAVMKTNNAVLIERYAEITALKLGVSVQAVLTEFKKIPMQPSMLRGDDMKSSGSMESAESRAQPSPAEIHLLKLLLLDDELARWAALHLDVNWIAHPDVRQIADLRIAAQEHETWHSVAEFLDSCESAQQRSLITEAVAEDRKIPNPEIQLADVTLKLRNQFLDRQIGALTQKISQPETGDEERVQWLREQMKLKDLKRQPLAQSRRE
jgi:hypothetical protein